MAMQGFTVDFEAFTVTANGCVGTPVFKFHTAARLARWLKVHHKREVWLAQQLQDRRASRSYWAQPKNKLRLLQMLLDAPGR